MPKSKTPAKAPKDKVKELQNEIAKLRAESMMKDIRIQILQETIEELKPKKRKFNLKNLLLWR